MSGEELIEKLADDPVGRLRWRVCRAFGILPFSRAARQMTDREAVFCGAQMVLDRREGDGTRSFEGAQNSGFDKFRFEALVEGRR